MSVSEHDQRQIDQQSQREIDAHDESLKRAIEAGHCPKCYVGNRTEINPRNITFRCKRIGCGWSAIYPIAVIGNSDRSAIYTTRGALRATLMDVIDGGSQYGNGDWDFINPDETVADANRLVFCSKVIARLSAYKDTK